MSLLGKPFDNKLNTIPTGIKFSNDIIPKIKSPIKKIFSLFSFQKRMD
jgi:hypothetical protein